MPSARPWRSGRPKDCRRTRWPGWCPRAASSPSTSSGATSASNISRIAPTSPNRSPIRRRALDEREELLEDDRLRLVFTCCHPALAPDAQVALTLREVCGLATEEIAAAFLTPAPTHRAAHRARQGQDSRRQHSLPGARARGAAGAARKRAARGLPGVQRGLLGQQRRVGHARGSVGRGDPARPSHRRADARSPKREGC